MKILLLEPFLGGSHQSWAEALKANSRHEILIMGLKAHNWKWRMHGAAITLAERYLQSDFQADLILATDMLDLTTFLALTRKKTAATKTLMYFHENQLTYPWSPHDQDIQLQRKHHYAFINYASALAADACCFNSDYHQNAFLEALPGFLNMFPQPNNAYTCNLIKEKSRVLHLGMELKKFDEYYVENKAKRALILWNHRWEYDKNPEAFFQALFELKRNGIEFDLAVLGQAAEQVPAIFEEAKTVLAQNIVHWGFVDSFEAYAHWLWKADILPITNLQDFFGMSIIEAVYCNCKPLLPRRLAYPEHFQQPYLQQSFFYEDDKSLAKRIQGMLFHVQVLRKQKTEQYVNHYDWSTMIDHYDDFFEDLMNEFNKPSSSL